MWGLVLNWAIHRETHGEEGKLKVILKKKNIKEFKLFYLTNICVFGDHLFPLPIHGHVENTCFFLLFSLAQLSLTTPSHSKHFAQYFSFGFSFAQNVMPAFLTQFLLSVQSLNEPLCPEVFFFFSFPGQWMAGVHKTHPSGACRFGNKKSKVQH